MALALTLALLVLYFADPAAHAWFDDIRPSHVLAGIAIGLTIAVIVVKRNWR
jgi:hypothetical protein